MEVFRPTALFIDPSVRDAPLTQRVLQYFPHLPLTWVDDPSRIKNELPLTESKKKLFITRHKGGSLKTCQGAGDYVCCNYLTLSLASNCHFECSYCILQDYLKNNPIMTLFANVDEILAELDQTLQQNPTKQFRVGTGELADSLALDSLTQFSKTLIPFAAQRNNLVFELKTKSDCIENLLPLDHQGKTVIGWSLNPQSFIDQEEYKTASLKRRLQAAQAVAEAGYPVGLHFDPLLALPHWEKEYAGLIQEVRQALEPSSIAWISLGSLRYTPRLKDIVVERFPKSKIFYGELYPSVDGKVRYLREIREEMYGKVQKLVREAFPQVPNYLCMETSRVWGKTYGTIPHKNGLENHISERFAL